MTTAYSNTRAILACILGVLSLSCLPGLLTGLPAVLLGAFELKAVRNGQAPRQNAVFAWVGVGFGSLACLLSIVLLVYVGVEVVHGAGDFFHGLMHSKWF